MTMILRGMLTLLILMTCAAPTVAGASGFRSMLFDGASFQESAGEGALLVGDGLFPVEAGAESPRKDPLPSGTGALAVFCYRQNSGGKLRKQPGAAPMAGVVVTILGGQITVAARTDAKGYIVLALPPGNYEIKWLNFTKHVAVENGKTALAAIRGGKRMVD